MDLDRPTSYSFTCNQCNRGGSSSAIAGSEGRCPKCNAEQWTLQATFVWVEVSGNEIDAQRLGIAMLSGRDPGARRELETMERIYDDVPAKHALWIVSHRNTKDGVLGYVNKRVEHEAKQHRKRMEEQGGRNCLHCNAFFVPVENKPFTAEGYCSKACYVGAGRAQGFDPSEAKIRNLDGEDAPRRGRKFGQKIAVICGCGNEFQAPNMYAGTMRPCPACGAKCSVPTG